MTDESDKPTSEEGLPEDPTLKQRTPEIVKRTIADLSGDELPAGDSMFQGPSSIVKRGPADLSAPQDAPQGRPLSNEPVDEDRTAPGLQIPTSAPPPAPASASGQFIAVTPAQAHAQAQANAQAHRAASSQAPTTMVPVQPVPGQPGPPGGYQGGASASDSNLQMRASPGPAPRVPIEEPPPKKSLGKRLLPTLGAGIVAFLLVGWALLSEWPPPHVALLFMSVGMLVPTVLTALLTSSGSKNSMLARAMPALFVSAAGIAGAFAWSMDSVRVQAVPFAPDKVRTMMKMLGDGSVGVAAVGCERYAAHSEDSTWWSALFDALSSRPQLASACMQRLPQAEQDRIGRSLADRWGRELIGAERKVPEVRAREIAAATTLLGLPKAESGERLLACNLTATSAEAQKACGDALASMIEDPAEWASLLPAIMEFSMEGRVAVGVYAMAFHGEGLSVPQRELAKAVNFSGVETQRVAFDLACKAIPAKDSDVIRHLKAALDEQCTGKLREIPKDRPAWSKLCAATQLELAGDVKKSPIPLLCTTFSETAIPDTFDLARSEVGRSIAAGLAPEESAPPEDEAAPAEGADTADMGTADGGIAASADAGSAP